MIEQRAVISLIGSIGTANKAMYDVPLVHHTVKFIWHDSIMLQYTIYAVSPIKNAHCAYCYSMILQFGYKSIRFAISNAREKRFDHDVSCNTGSTEFRESLQPILG